MNDEQKTEEESWAVEPPKKDGNKKRKALRVALIVAALGAVTLAGVVWVIGNSTIKQSSMPIGGAIDQNPREEVCVGQRAGIQEAEAYRHNVICDDIP